MLHVLWPLMAPQEYTTVEGVRVMVLQNGEYDERRGKFCGAKIRIGDNIHHGEVVIWAGDSLPAGSFESTVLHVAPYRSASILDNDGEPISQVHFEPDPVCQAVYGNLREGAHEAGCGAYIASMESLDRLSLFTRLMVDRLYRKYTEVRNVFEECDKNWSETLYVMMLRAMGKPYNTEAYGELARIVPYKYICLQRSSLMNIEALLLGASGLLEAYQDDQYIRELKTTFKHQCNKFGITPMRAGQWKIRQKPGGHPVLRLAQLATLLTNRDYLFDAVRQCDTVEDIHRFFDTEASLYWSTHYIPGEDSVFRPKKLGHERANVMGINFIVPVQFAYGVAQGDDVMKEKAFGLLEKINPESNRIIDRWRSKGVLTENAFDTQAVLQLHNDNCMKGRCWMCAVGKRIVKEAYARQTAQKM